MIALSPDFLTYLRADGIILPPDPKPSHQYAEPLTPPPSDADSSADDWDDDGPDPSADWPDIHAKIMSTIESLGGSVFPKLNWSAPKDATWINATNSMECRSANDVYLLLKSSDFVTHDLEQLWDGCEDVSSSEDEEAGDGTRDFRSEPKQVDLPYHLVLRKTIPALNPALEFRCFVRARQLLCLCQRDMNYFSFLSPLVAKFRSLIQGFFEKNLQRAFPDQDFVFDVYIPPPHDRVWLIDINPWARRTDPLLFSWLEILTMPPPERLAARAVRADVNDEGSQHVNEDDRVKGDDQDSDEEVEEVYTPELRLVGRDDPEAYAFNSQQYSAHKLPRDVVDASLDGQEGLREFMSTWRDIVKRQEESDAGSDINGID